MLGRMIRAAAVMLVGAITLGLVWLRGMRDKQSGVVRFQRRVNRAVFNPRQLKSAGKPGAYASIVRHTGRTSGRHYETPVGAEATDDGFVIALVYGSGSDWVKNVVAAGTATIVHEGVTYQVERPEVVPLDEAIDAFPESDRRSLRFVGVRECLRVRRA